MAKDIYTSEDGEAAVDLQAYVCELRAENERLRDALRYARERLDALDQMDECMTLTDMRMIDEALGEGE